MSGKPNDGLDDIIDNLTQNLMKKKKITDKSDEIRNLKNIKQSPHKEEQDDVIIDNLTQNLMKKKKITDKSDEIRPPKNIKQPHDDEQDDDLIDGINYYKIIGVTPQ